MIHVLMWLLVVQNRKSQGILRTLLLILPTPMSGLTRDSTFTEPLDIGARLRWVILQSFQQVVGL